MPVGNLDRLALNDVEELTATPNGGDARQGVRYHHRRHTSAIASASASQMPVGNLDRLALNDVEELTATPNGGDARQGVRYHHRRHTSAIASHEGGPAGHSDLGNGTRVTYETDGTYGQKRGGSGGVSLWGHQ